MLLTRKERDESTYVESLVTRLSWNEVHDKICQTPLTFDPNLGQHRFVEAIPHEHGAFEFHNEVLPTHPLEDELSGQTEGPTFDCFSKLKILHR